MAWQTSSNGGLSLTCSPLATNFSTQLQQQQQLHNHDTESVDRCLSVLGGPSPQFPTEYSSTTHTNEPLELLAVVSRVRPIATVLQYYTRMHYVLILYMTSPWHPICTNSTAGSFSSVFLRLRTDNLCHPINYPCTSYVTVFSVLGCQIVPWRPHLGLPGELQSSPGNGRARHSRAAQASFDSMMNGLAVTTCKTTIVSLYSCVTLITPR